MNFKNNPHSRAHTIQFRAKSIDSGDWVYGGFALVTQDGTDMGMITTRNADIIPVDIDTVCEYTGTKDWADTSIFEGDVLKVENDYGTEYCYVFYDNDCGKWKLMFPDGEAIILEEYLDDPDTKVYTNMWEMWEVQDLFPKNQNSTDE